MRKFFIFLFKVIAPLGILLVPIIATFETRLDYVKGVAFLMLIVILFIFIKKAYKKIAFKRNHEREHRESKFWTNFKYELSQLMLAGFVFGLLNLISNYIGQINKFIIYIVLAYFIGAVIEISGSDELKNNETIIE